MRKNAQRLTFILSLLVAALLVACQQTNDNASSTPAATETALLPTTEPTAPPAVATAEVTPTQETAVPNTIIINPADASPISPAILGTNIPAWLGNDRLSNDLLQARTAGAGVSLIRLPGGSWSNYYDWLACERGGAGIDETAECYWPWAAKPTDFINYLNATGLEGMYTINMNGTAKEAAALVAFFNGSVEDETVIGVDVRGRDWGNVSDWAQLRRANGNPEPVGLRYFEIGNEIYGGKDGMGTDCAFGWEDVWTCDGTEYVNGIGTGSERKEGFLEYLEAMKAVDPAIWVGAVGIPYQDEWSNWGNEVIAAAGQAMDFYIIHHYGFFEPPLNFADALAEPAFTWPAVMADVQAAFDQYADGRDVPVAITEYNMFSVQDMDNSQLMTQLVNALYTADTVGQMMANGVQMATHWNLANGQAGNGTDYGLINADTYDPYPQFYTYTLWSRFGSEMLAVRNPFPADTTLAVYAGRIDENTLSVLAINKTGEAVETAVQLQNSPTITSALMDQLAGDALDAQTITFNGSSAPAADFSDAPSEQLAITGNPFTVTFPPYSITLIRLELDS